MITSTRSVHGDETLLVCGYPWNPIGDGTNDLLLPLTPGLAEASLLTDMPITHHAGVKHQGCVLFEM